MSQHDRDKDSNAKAISRRDFLQTAGMAAIAVGSGVMAQRPRPAQAASPRTTSPKSGKPLTPTRHNVLFILTDQERYQPELQGKGHWPGRDRLAEMGRRLRITRSVRRSARLRARLFLPDSTSSIPVCSTIPTSPGSRTCRSTFPPLAT